jgi:hypothetical protein
MDYNLEATPLNPAYIIYNYETKKQLIFCLRGSYNWADAITDIACFQLEFIIYRNEKNDSY